MSMYPFITYIINWNHETVGQPAIAINPFSLPTAPAVDLVYVDPNGNWHTKQNVPHAVVTEDPVGHWTQVGEIIS